MSDIDPSTTADPGNDISHRPLAKWISDVEQDQDLLRAVVQHLRKTPKGRTLASNDTLNRIAAGDERRADYKKCRFQNWIRGKPPERLDTSEVSRVLQYLVRTFRELEFGHGSGAHEDLDRLVDVVSLLNDYLNVSPHNLEGQKDRFEGYYWVFRPSVTAPRRFIRGLLGMRWVAQITQAHRSSGNGMIRTCEVHRHPGDEGHSMPLLFESYDGFALIKTGVFFAFMAERFAELDRGPLHITRMPNFLPADRRQPLQMAWGRTIGASNLAHSLPIVIVRITEDEMKTESGGARSLTDLERLWSQPREKSGKQQPGDYLFNLLNRCGIVDPEDANGIPPTVLAQIDALNREAWLFSEQFRSDQFR